MATPEDYREDECYNVYWKIKNFSYFCGAIMSPKFRFSNLEFNFYLTPSFADIKCRIRRYDGQKYSLQMQISILTCDGSPEESVIGGADVELQVLKDVIFGSRRSFLPEDTLTIRFRSLTKSERGKLLICSQIGVKHYYFLWTLKDFKNPWDAEKVIEYEGLYGHISLNLKSLAGIVTGEQFSIEISRYGGQKCVCVLKMSIIDAHGRALNEVSDEFVFDGSSSREQRRGFPSVIKKSKWIEYKNMLLLDDTLSLKCYFAISLGNMSEESSVITYCENAAPLLKEYGDISVTFYEKNDSDSVTELQADLKNTLDDGTLFDVSLQIGSESIRAHKVILSARSPVFKAMFTKDVKEAVSRTVVIEDVDIETVRKLLLYIYTNSIEDGLWENLVKLYIAADKYEVLNLKKKCSSILRDRLTICNVCEALIVSDLHHDEDLMAAAIDYISVHDSAVFALEVWNELEKNYSSLALKCMREICCNKKVRLN